MLVAVASRRDFNGVYAPGENKGRGDTHDWRARPGSPDNRSGVRAVYEVMEIEDAFRRVYDVDDAHFVPYIVIDPDGNPLKFQPRVNKTGLPWLYNQGYQVLVQGFIADIDAPNHKDGWNEGTLGDALDRFATNPWFRDKFHYFSRGGERAGHPAATPFQAFCANGAMHQWCTDATLRGIHVDMKCKYWYWHYRLPNVRRILNDGSFHNSRAVTDFEDMRPIDATAWIRVPRFHPSELEEFGVLGERRIAEAAGMYGWEDADSPVPSAKTRRIPGNLRIIDNIPSEYLKICEALGDVLSDVAIGTGHTLYMKLAGALLYRGIKAEFLPAVVAKIAQIAGHDGDNYYHAGSTTAHAYASGGKVMGFPKLREEYPALAKTLEEIGFRGGAKSVAAQQATAAATNQPAGSLDQVQKQIYNEIRFSQDRIIYIESSCGSGKTYIASQVVADRYRDADRTPTGRLKGDSHGTVGKTAVTGDKHVLAIQTMKAIQGFDVPVKRLFSPASLRDAQGNVVCKFEDVATAMAAGGLSVPKLLCRGNGKNPCQYLDGCAAAIGWEGDEKSMVVVATHAKLKQVVAEAGSSALLVIDEPPPLLRNEILTEDDLAHAEKNLGSFEDRYADAMRPMLGMVAGWFAAEPPGGAPRSAQDIAYISDTHVNQAHLYIAQCATSYHEKNGGPGLDAFAVARHAITEGEDAVFAPLKTTRAIQACRYSNLAKAIGRANKTLHTLYECAMGALANDFPPKLRVEEARDGKVLRVVCPNHTYVEVLKNHGRIVILGAKADLHVREIQAVAGCPVTTKRFAVADGAPVARTIMPSTTANRSMWIPHGVPLWENGIISALERAIAWAQEDPNAKDLCLITFRPIAVALEATLAPQEARWAKVWGEDLGLPAKTLQKARQVLQPVVSLWRGTWVIGYYGGTRGMNHAQHVQAIVSLGDPRPNVDAEQVTAAYMKIQGEDYVQQKAQEELEQVHGRLRAPQRTEPARALHVGIVVPYGYGWDQAEQRQVVGTHTKPTAMSADEFAELRTKLGLTQVDLAERLDVTERSVKRYEAGSRIPSGIALALRRLLIGQ